MTLAGSPSLVKRVIAAKMARDVINGSKRYFGGRNALTASRIPGRYGCGSASRAGPIPHNRGRARA